MTPRCTVTLPWPCEKEPAGGTTPLGSVLCPRHLAGVLAPPRPPDIDRAALRKYFPTDRTQFSKPHENSALDPETTAAIVALAPLGATVQTWYPTYPRQETLRMTTGARGSRSRDITPEELPVRSTARAAASGAVSSGWLVSIAAVDDPPDVLMTCYRARTFVCMGWREGKFAYAWLLTAGELESLGYRRALALLAAPYAEVREDVSQVRRVEAAE